MESEKYPLPQIGDLAPSFSVETDKGIVSFPDYSEGRWCVFFAHPANFTSCWTMFSAFLGRKERWLNERDTKVLALSNEPLNSGNDWSDKARRFLGIYLNAPVIEDIDFKIAKIYGLASTRRPQPGLNRLAVVIDPEGVIRMIINRPLPNVVQSLDQLALELDRLQGYREMNEKDGFEVATLDHSDLPGVEVYRPRPAYFRIKDFGHN